MPYITLIRQSSHYFFSQNCLLWHAPTYAVSHINATQQHHVLIDQQKKLTSDSSAVSCLLQSFILVKIWWFLSSFTDCNTHFMQILLYMRVNFFQHFPLWEIFSFIKLQWGPFWKGCVIHGSKQDVTEVTPLFKSCRKTDGITVHSMTELEGN